MQKGIEVLNSVIVNIPIVGASRYRFNPGFSNLWPRNICKTVSETDR